MSDRRRIGWKRYLLWRTVRGAWRGLGSPLFRLHATGTESLPREGPYLLLPNHHGALDPAWVTQEIGRPAHYMASANLFRFPRLGPFITALGAFPKEKFVKDRSSMAAVEQLYRQGAVVCIFPEGERTWDLRLNPVGEGLGRLIKRLDARVVYCRQHTAFHWQPRWARYPRWVPVRVDYDPPIRYPPEASPAEITAHATERMRVPLQASFSSPTLGLGMAHGLPDFLWACPRCHEPGALQVSGRRGNHLRCSSCDARWQLTVEADLLGLSTAARSYRLDQAYDAITDPYGDPPRQDEAALQREGLVFRTEGVQLALVHRDRAEPELMQSGPLRLYTDRIEVGRSQPWVMPLREVRAIPMEMHNSLQIRSGDQTWTLDLGSSPTLRFVHFARPWHRRAGG